MLEKWNVSNTKLLDVTAQNLLERLNPLIALSDKQIVHNKTKTQKN